MESNSMLSLIVSCAVMLIAEIGYFKLADRYNIIDKPNERSSHMHHTIRGGGIIFVFGVLIWFLQSGFQYPWFVVALILTAIISFFDDITSLHAGTRFLVHLVSMLLVLYQIWPLSWPLYLLIMAVIVCIGTLNAFNFMDGINGITGIYALVTLLTYGYINQFVFPFTNLSFLIWVGASVIIFLFFNFRTVAACFAGDVGSISMALILVFLMLQLVRATGNFLWPLLFLVYGTDSIVTIIYRLRRRENIFKAHRSHLFQYLSNEMKISHLVVSSGYGLMQGLINFLVVVCLKNSNRPMAIILTAFFIIFYFFVRGKVLSKIKASHS